MTEEFKAKNVKMNVNWDNMVRIAGICVTKTVTLQADVTGLPEAVSEDVNLDTQETRVIRNVTLGNMGRIVSKTVLIVNKETSVTTSTVSVWKDALQDTMDHVALNHANLVYLD